MARFTTRVQFNGHPTADDYEGLHKAMKRKGFSRTVTSDDGKRYWLPHAEYNRDAAVTRDQALTDAKAAAATIATDYEVLVTASAGRTWHGLKTTTAAEGVAG